MNSGRVPSPTDLATFGAGTLLGAAASIKKGDVVFNRYTLDHILGVGGMGVVWLASDNKLDNQQVAIKFVPDALRHDAEAIQDLKNQTKLGLKLAHDNIVRIQSFESDSDLAAIVMEYVEGPTLSSMRVDQPLQVFEHDTLHVYLLGVLKALEYAHDEAGIVHRDIKPANIMVNSEDKVKVADFGIACSIRNSVGKVMSMPQRSGSGTLHYMSPQQLMGGPGCVADDIYSLGATVFELMTGTPPFFSGDIGTQIREVPAPSMTARRQQNRQEGEFIPDAWETVIAACLSKDPSLRPTNVGEIRKGLLGEPFKRGTGTGAVAFPPAHHTSSPPHFTPPPPPPPTHPSAGAYAPHAPQATKSAGLSTSVILSSLAVVVVTVFAGVMMLKTDAPKPKDEDDKDRVKVAAVTETKYLNDLVSQAESFENEQASPSDKLKRWTNLLSTVRGSAYQDELAIRSITQRVQDRTDYWKREVEKTETTYAINVSDLKNSVEEATKYSESKDKGSAAKAAKWADILAKFLPMFSNDMDATEHLTLVEEARKQQKIWQAKATDEEPKAMPPENLVFSTGPAAGWADYGKKELLKIIQSGLAFKGSVGVSSTGKWDNPTFLALKELQKEKELPVSGVLDAYTLAALGLQAMPEPKAGTVVVQTRSGNGGGGGSSERSAPAAQETNPWAKAVQDNISRGGVPRPGFPGMGLPFGR